MFANLLAGGFSGAFTLIFVYPLDMARVQLAADLSPNNARHYHDSFNVAQKILKQNGIAGLYKGLSVGLFSVFYSRGITFGAYAISTDPTYPIYLQLAAAYGLTFFSFMFTYPAEVIMHKMMLQSNRPYLKYGSVRHCVKMTILQEGFTKGFYAGFGPAITKSFFGTIGLVYAWKIEDYIRRNL